MIKDAHDALMDVQSSGRSKELLAQVCVCVCVCVCILLSLHLSKYIACFVCTYGSLLS